MQRANLIFKLCFTNKYSYVAFLLRESNEKTATTNIQQYIIDLIRNYSFTWSLYHFFLDVTLKEQSHFN